MTHLLQCVACVAVCCYALQCVAVCCSVLQCVICHDSRATGAACFGGVIIPLCICCSVLQCVAVCCSVLQCVAVCCSVLKELLFEELFFHYDSIIYAD